MNPDQAREAAIAILGEFEELLASKNVVIPSADREGRKEEACLYGCEYYGLEDAIVEILAGPADVARDAAGDAIERQTKSDKRSLRDSGGYAITLTLTEGDFEQSLGRRPRSRAEFAQWARLCEKGLLNGHIDWSIVFDCAREALDARNT